VTLRHRRETGDVPPVVAAHHMGCTSLTEFEAKLPELMERGFPPPDPTTGNFDLDAIKAWRKLRHPQLYPQSENPRLSLGPIARHAGHVTRERLRKVPGG
jgi:hypothetical protein